MRTLTDVFRRLDLRVLAVDLDPQGNLSDYLDVDPDATPTIGDVLAGSATAREAIHDGIIPANLGLAEAELMLGGKMGRELTLKKALREVSDDYDLILIDCPPALGLLTVNALVASDYALLSAEAQYFALQGVEQALEVIELARDSLNPDLQLARRRAEHRRHAHPPLARGVRVAARALRRASCSDTTIRSSIAYAESAERAVSILDYRPDLAADYLDVADELLARLGLEDARGGSRAGGSRGQLAPAPEAERYSDDVGALGLERRPQHRPPSRRSRAAGARRSAPRSARSATRPARSARRRRSSRRARRARRARSSSSAERGYRCAR